jgi:spore germination cell wall hydrolase CwlJ-like protein
MLASLISLEPHPRDFAARFKRRRVATLGLQLRRRSRGRRALVVLAAFAAPALATPDNWRAFGIGNAGAADVVVEPLPFERPGDSFPGSAFYYLAPEEVLPPLVQTESDQRAGPIARAMRIDNSGIDRTRALQCLAAAVYYEARSESDQGQRAVAQVVLNRVAHPSYPDTVCGVVYQGSERTTGCQFSFTCDGSLANRPNLMFWQRAQSVARAALSGYVERSVGLATHYHTIAINPYWAPSLRHIITVGAHRFYRFGGAAGEAGAFRFTYAGGEPLAAPHSRTAAADRESDTTLDSLAVQRAYEAELKAATEVRADEALYPADRLPQGNGIRPEYRNSGRWIGEPAI